MAGIFDFLSLLLTAALFVGAIVGIIWIISTIQETVKSTKDSLKAKGLHITDHGVSVKTNKRFDREDYVDAQQRAFIKGMSATSFGKVDENGQHVEGASPNVSRQSSSTTVPKVGDEEKKKSRFGLRKGTSGGSK